MLLAYQGNNELKVDTMSYLKKGGFDVEADVEKMTIVDMGQEEETKAVVVTFKDEPEVDYYYSYKTNTNQITQIDAINKGINQEIKPEFDVYDGNSLRIAVIGEPPKVKEEQIKFNKISFDEISTDEMKSYDAIFIMKENLMEAAESQYADVYSQSTIPFFFIAANSYIPFTVKDTAYRKYWEWDPGNSYVVGVPKTEKDDSLKN